MEQDPRSIADSVGLLRRQLGLGSASGFAAMTEMWPGLVGEELSSRCRVIDLRAGTMTVDAYDPATAEMLKWSERRLVDSLSAASPGEKLSKINVRVRRAGTS